jgi:hypothetical protein
MTTVAEQRAARRDADTAQARYQDVRVRFTKPDEAFRAITSAPPERIDSAGRRHVIRDKAEALAIRHEIEGEMREVTAEFRDSRAALMETNVGVANAELGRLLPDLRRAEKRVVKAEATIREVTARLIACGWVLNEARHDRLRLSREVVAVACKGAPSDDVTNQIKASARGGTITVRLDAAGEPAEHVGLSDNHTVGDHAWFAGIGENVEAGAYRAERVWADHPLLRVAVRMFKTMRGN